MVARTFMLVILPTRSFVQGFNFAESYHCCVLYKLGAPVTWSIQEPGPTATALGIPAENANKNAATVPDRISGIRFS